MDARRARGPGVSQLSYWSDNQAGYSWWTAGPDQAIWGLPEDIYLKLKAGYDAVSTALSDYNSDEMQLFSYEVLIDPRIKGWDPGHGLGAGQQLRRGLPPDQELDRRRLEQVRHDVLPVRGRG